MLGEGWQLTQPDPAPDPGQVQDDLLALRLELVLTALDSLAESLRDLPQPQVFIDAPDLSAIVQAVNGLKPGADPEEIAQAVVKQIAPTAQKPEPDAVYSELVKALEKLDFRLRGVGNSSAGTVLDLKDNAARLVGHVTVDALPTGTDQVQGNAASGATDAGNPLKIGGRYSASAPTPVADGQRVNQWFDAFGRPNMALHSAELNTSVALTSLRDLQIVQRYTVLADSVADGLAGFWTSSTTGSGIAATVTGGEGLIQSGAATNSSSQLMSTPVRYYPGQSTWFNSAYRFGDTGVTGNTRRLGVFTVTGTAPQDGFCFELIDTTFYASVYKGGSLVSQVPAASWSRAAASPFTLDTNYHSFEIRYTANSVWFYIDNVVKHVYAGTTTAITSSLSLPMTMHSINTTNATNCVLAVRNVGIGRFGQQPTDYSSGEIRPDQTGAGGVLTFTFTTPVDFIWVNDVGATTTNVSRVDPFGGTPSATAGIAVYNATPTPIQVVPPSATVKVYAATGSTISMYGLRYV